MNDINKKGLSTTLLCCLIWGLLPLYWALLNQVSSFSVLSHRIIWSGVWMFFLVIITGRQQLRIDIHYLRTNLTQLGLLLLAAMLISINWFTYIWAVTNQHVLDTSLGYYINPLLNVLLGIVIYKETLLWSQKLSIAIAVLGVSIMTYELGSLPIISIVLAVTFSLYGAIKKRLTIHPFSSIAMEAWLITPIALWYVLTVDTTSWSFIENMTPTGLLLVASGLTTSVPLILFSYGARLLPLNVLGFLQYLSPTMGFFLAIFYFGESFGTAQLTAFGCIWVALVLFSLSNRITTRISLKK
ncbi:EamA family transporter RarD [uncultured Veillonella sp.]|uniref:EamA family transporter RarD n=1 Tax=uncultured Veillonella sp. TaxID=159268 RepID=UPI0025D6BE79|nr:EamA family transporter RarD [uncultured Veillonella sp.]